MCPLPDEAALCLGTCGGPMAWVFLMSKAPLYRRQTTCTATRRAPRDALYCD